MKKVIILVILLILVSLFFIKENQNTAKLYTKSITLSKNLNIPALVSINVTTFPQIFIDSPLNKTYNNNIISLNFTILSNNNIQQVYYTVDNGLPIFIPLQNITISIPESLINIKNSYKLALYGIDTLAQLNSNSVTFSFNLSLPWKVMFTKFNGATTNFSSFNKSQLYNLNNVILENLGYGKINYNQVINISRDINLDLYTNISFNRIEMQSEFIPEFNKSTTLKLYNLKFIDPIILVNGRSCPGFICTKNSYSNGTLSFNVTGFSVYSAEDASSVSSAGTPGDGGSGGGGSSGGGGNLINTNQNLLQVGIEIIQVGKLTIYQNDTITIPILIRNKGQTSLKNITLQATTNTKNISLNLDKTFIDELKENQIEKTSLKITSYNNLGKYQIILNAKVTNPDVSDTSNIFIDLVEKDYSNRKNFAQVQLEFLKRLFKSNTECLELEELLLQDEKAINNKQYEKAVSLGNLALDNCKYLLTKKGKKINLLKLIKPNEVAILIIELIILVFMVYGLRYYIMRKKLKM